jgi:hypothetical protein
MSEIAKATEAPSPLLQNYLTEERIAAEIGKGERTLRQMRQKRTGPPFVKFGQTILYPRDGFLAWLKSLEQSPPRSRNGRAA